MKIKEWKKFYKNERNAKEEEIKYLSRAYWNKRKTSKEIDRLLDKGVVSFPHTKLIHSLKPILEILTSIYKLKKEKIVLIGVLHGLEKNSEKEEFSLDNFIAISKTFTKENNLPHLKIKKIFHEKMIKKRTEKNILNYIKKLKEQSKKLKKGIDSKTALIITGDIMHNVGSPDKLKFIKKRIIKNLKFCYEKKDYLKFFKDCLKIHGDHIATSIITSELLGKRLKIKILSIRLTNYKDEIKTKDPSKVSSVVYGVSK
ncbi:MAG: hypothetical protein WC812_00785 [Candidatus Pacearchaeota archaeon]|jgi:hypothetical protein